MLAQDAAVVDRTGGRGFSAQHGEEQFGLDGISTAELAEHASGYEPRGRGCPVAWRFTAERVKKTVRDEVQLR